MIAKGGNIRIDKAVTTINLSGVTQPVNLILSAKVDNIVLDEFKVPVSVKVEKDVEFPAMKTTGKLDNFTLIGDLATTKPCHQLKMYELGTSIGSLTIKNVKFDGTTLPAQNGSPILDDRNVTDNLVVDGCVFENLKHPAVATNKGNINGKVVVKNCTISYANDAISTTNGLYLLHVNNVEATGNTITNAPYNGIFVRAYVSAKVEGNTIVNAKADGVKIETEESDKYTDVFNNSVVVRNNTIQGGVNGIRICKGYRNLSRNVTISGNTIDMSKVTADWNEDDQEPSAILLHTKAFTFNPFITVVNNTLTPADYAHKFNMVGFTPTDGSNFANPFNN